MKVTHALGPVWAAHAKEALEAISRLENDALIYDGKAAIARRDAESMRNHLRLTVGVIERESQLPKSIGGYALSEDGTALLGQIEAQENG